MSSTLYLILVGIVVASLVYVRATIVRNNKLLLRAYAYAGYDLVTVMAGRTPSAFLLIDALRNEQHLLARRAERITEKLKAISAEDSSFLTNSVSTFEQLLSSQLREGATSGEKTSAVALATRGRMCGNLADWPEDLIEPIHAWSDDSLMWCEVVIKFGPRFSEEAHQEYNKLLNGSV